MIVCRILHDPTITPPHQWLAVYRWITRGLRKLPKYVREAVSAIRIEKRVGRPKKVDLEKRVMLFLFANSRHQMMNKNFNKF
ncbi:CobN/Magnesium Chelatase [Archaeoglobus fulgidus DSM 8774]|uniref:CobN/Magnesium Chelatase n=1 Tax=Archaeoglobus fulgidus DSM 8774 TaxID=1344584 RepID=A0A075WGD5_ARCFL|nr:CobN/Magnesium Chelatase [Archaeoglobus fulgidus DSM 8774]